MQAQMANHWTNPILNMFFSTMFLAPDTQLLYVKYFSSVLNSAQPHV